MRKLSPPTVYIHERVTRDPRAVARAERMLAAMTPGEVVRGVTDEELLPVIEREGLGTSRRETGGRKTGDPLVILNAFDFEAPDRVGTQGNGNIFRGGGAWRLRDRDAVMQSDGTVCQTGWELHTARGCLFRCDYCTFQNVLNIAVNIESCMESLADFIDAHDQTLYKWDSTSDILALEREYDAARPMGEFFGRQSKAFLMHYTKSDNVDVLRDIAHNGRTMVCWSMAAETQTRATELDTASWQNRIEAMRKCQEWGYPIRCRLSPIAPVKNWREENAILIRRLFERARPEVISLLCLSRLPDYEMFPRVFDLDLFDPTFVEAAQASRAEMAGKVVGPFPHEKRAEVYRFLIDEIRRASPETPVSLCLETPEMWEELGDTMGLSHEAYPCCCGGMCTPDNPIMAQRTP